MTTESDLVNRAYAQIGESVILSSLSENSVEARNGKIAYERARDYHLNSFSWSFCKKRIVPALMESEIAQYAYCYALPSDFINIIALFPYGAGADFQSDLLFNYTRQLEYSSILIEDYIIEPHSQAVRAIYTNAENPTLYYTASITDPNLFSEHLKEAIVYTTADYLLAVTIVKQKQEGTFYLPEDINDELEYSLTNKNISFSVELTLQFNDLIGGFGVNGAYSHGDDTIELVIEYNPNTIEQQLYDLIGEVNEVLTHEMVHLNQNYKEVQTTAQSASYAVTSSYSLNSTGNWTGSNFVSNIATQSIAAFNTSGYPVLVTPTLDNVYLVIQNGIMKWIPIASVAVSILNSTFYENESVVDGLYEAAITSVSFVSSFTSGSI